MTSAEGCLLWNRTKDQLMAVALSGLFVLRCVCVCVSPAACQSQFSHSEEPQVSLMPSAASVVACK